MYRRFPLFCALLIAATLTGADGRLIVTGSSTIAPVVAEIAKRIESQHPGVRIEVQTGGSSRGVSDAASGLSDIGMVSRAWKSEESAQVVAHVLALDGMAVIVHSTNAVPELTKDQVISIYTGKITDWSAVGGKAGPITVVNMAEGRSTLELFCHHHGLKNAEINAQVVIGDNEQGVKTVAGNPGAIGYVSIGTAEYDATHGVPIKLLPIGDVAASTETVQKGVFPLSRPLHIVTRTPPVGLAKAFIEYAQSKAVHDLIRQQYFVPLAD